MKFIFLPVLALLSSIPTQHDTVLLQQHDSTALSPCSRAADIMADQITSGACDVWEQPSFVVAAECVRPSTYLFSELHHEAVSVDIRNKKKVNVVLKKGRVHVEAVANCRRQMEVELNRDGDFEKNLQQCSPSNFIWHLEDELQDRLRFKNYFKEQLARGNKELASTVVHGALAYDASTMQMQKDGTVVIKLK